MNFEFVPELPTTPRHTRNDPLLIEFASALRANPEQWAKYPLPRDTPSAAATLAYRINDGGTLAPKVFRADDTGRFQAASRGADTFVRYLKDAQ